MPENMGNLINILNDAMNVCLKYAYTLNKSFLDEAIGLFKEAEIIDFKIISSFKGIIFNTIKSSFKILE
jgi:hypothetical protein